MGYGGLDCDSSLPANHLQHTVTILLSPAVESPARLLWPRPLGSRHLWRREAAGRASRGDTGVRAA